MILQSRRSRLFEPIADTNMELRATRGIFVQGGKLLVDRGICGWVALQRCCLVPGTKRHVTETFERRSKSELNLVFWVQKILVKRTYKREFPILPSDH